MCLHILMLADTWFAPFQETKKNLSCYFMWGHLICDSFSLKTCTGKNLFFLLEILFFCFFVRFNSLLVTQPYIEINWISERWESNIEYVETCGLQDFNLLLVFVRFLIIELFTIWLDFCLPHERSYTKNEIIITAHLTNDYQNI